MRVRKIVALSVLTLCVAGAAADIAVITTSSARTPLSAVAEMVRSQVSTTGVADEALPETPMAQPADADHPVDIAADTPAPPRPDRDLSDTATGTAVGLVAGILVGGLVGVIFGTATGVVLVLCAGAGVTVIPLVWQAFGSGVPADCVAGGLVGLTVGGIIGLIGVAAPAAMAGAVGSLVKNSGRR